MAFITHRVSRGHKYWSIVESRRVNGQSRQFLLEYLGTAKSLLTRLKSEDEVSIKSYAHGDGFALLNIAKELDLINIINKHVPVGANGKKSIRDDLTVGASLLMAAIGRACRPTSKRGWYNWCKGTSLEYVSKGSYKKLDSQHFWDQMDFLPVEKIALIEEEIVRNIVKKYDLKPDVLLYDTSNFFTFIASTNKGCDIAQRGKNKQRRIDLRQVGLALIASRKEQFPLFYRTYQGNKNDITVFKELLSSIVTRIRSIFEGLEDITIVFDKGNNSKKNFEMLDDNKDLHYVGGLVTSYFKDLVKEANAYFADNEVTVYKVKKKIWGNFRTCVVTVSEKLKEGQINGIHQQLEKKYKALEEFKQQLENPNKRKFHTKKEIDERLKKITNGQFISNILKYEIYEVKNIAKPTKDKDYSFIYFIDEDAFEQIESELLGKIILVTNRHDWDSKEIIQAYCGQSNVENVFRNLKNPYHMAVRPQFHWTDQKIEVHFFICMIGYLLTIAAYTEAKKRIEYKRDIHNFMEDLNSIRLSCRIKKNGKKVKYQLESMDKEILKLAKSLNITDDNLRIKINISDYV